MEKRVIEEKCLVLLGKKKLPRNTEEQFPLRLEGVSVHYIHGNRLQPVPDMLTKSPYDEALHWFVHVIP